MASPVLVRPRTGRVIGGVCAAIANRFGWDVSIVRIIAALAGIFTGAGIIVYIVMWVVIPEG